MHDLITQGFIYPNEFGVLWSLMIVLYPYITGLVAGAFIVSSLYHVFGDKDLKPVANLALVAAFCFILFCMTPLLFHLGKPFRCFNIMFTPNIQSAMSIFGYICFFYMAILIVEIWLVFRKDIVEQAQGGFLLKRWFYNFLALGVKDVSDESLSYDKKIIGFLAAIGIPFACILHGYVGFLFGAVKSNPWWSTPLMPIIFLLSAIISGIAILVLLYICIMKVSKKEIDTRCIQSICKYFWIFLIIDISLELLEVFNMAYEGEESWGIIYQLITGKLAFNYILVQGLIGSLVPLVLLGIVSLRKVKDSVLIVFASLSSFLILIQVFAMRWNVIIGGQLFSKSLRGFTSYTPSFLGKEGILVAIILFSLPFVALYIMSLILPIFKDEGGSEVNIGEGNN
ncbi:MAG: polysulfide reductase NrfD [Deltaproteobacteria bacterium]|jgi:Ni/Fe-hydrogenase subunit HybB-like protein|nr:polysulfide reductase NrfD [Deltaproteobacteria bacterium]